MTEYDVYTDRYSHYEELFNPELSTLGRNGGATKTKRKPKKATGQIVAELTEQTVGLEGGFNTTYQPARYESGWLLSSLRGFYDLGLITDVLARVKGGKEASVYRCKADESVGVEFLAAKVYRPRKFRSLSNDKMYREGRAVLTESGRAVKGNDHRIMRALNKKTAFGVQVAHTSWLMHEYAILLRLHAAGAAVPKPVAAGENAILMGYIGDEHRAAPTLHEVSLPYTEAQSLFEDVLRNVDLMLQNGVVHGDLSAYNVLYWQGAVTLIDFPQVTDSHNNASARSILQRDVRRVCEYFQQQGVECNAGAIANDLWRSYVSTNANDLLADFSRNWEEEEE